MPKLSASQTVQVEEAEEVKIGGFEAWPDGWYRARLRSVEDQESQAGNKMWNAAFENFRDEDGDKKRGSLWLRIMLPIKKMPKDYLPKKFRDEGLEVGQLDEDQMEERAASWKNYQNMTAARIKEFFAAFGLTSDSDTEEAVGQECAVRVGHETAQFGQRKGDVVNNIRELASLESRGWEEDGGDTSY